MDNLSYFISVFPQPLQVLFNNIDSSIKAEITEIRLRKNGYIIIYVHNLAYFILPDSTLSRLHNKLSVICDKDDFEIICDRLCSHSYHTNMSSLVNGFLTAPNGSRLGVSSTAVLKDGKVTAIRDITSLNIRISHEIDGCSHKILNTVYKNELPNIIVAGRTASGKTTFLRDYAKSVSSGFNNTYKKVCIIDERFELSSGFNVGINTDCLYGFSKASGIEIATRTLSPDLIICDEIGSLNELNAIKYSFASGVKFALSVHLGSINDIGNNQILCSLITTNQFDYLIYLNSYTYDFKIVNLKESEVEISRNDYDNFSFILPWNNDYTLS